MAYILAYHPDVETKDVPTLNRDVGKRIQALSQRVLLQNHKDMGNRLGER